MFSTVIKLLLAGMFLTGCAVMPRTDLRQQFLQGRPQAAIAALEERSGKSRRNALLTQMEKGLIYHTEQEYEKSAQAFLKAAQIMRDQDYLSLRRQAKTLIVNDWVGSYKGEYSERLWVHSYQMMNYLLLGQYQNAAVEARQALKVLEKYPEPLKNDWFSQTLIALSFESVGKINDAHIEYKKLLKKYPSDTLMLNRIERQARYLGMTPDEKKLPANLTDDEINPSSENRGELILFIADGIIPQKTSGDIHSPPDFRVSFPVYQSYFSPKPEYSVISTRGNQSYETVSTQLGKVISASLSARAKQVLLKEVTRVGIKKAIYEELKKEDKTAAKIIGGLFYLLEEADTRSWSTLPAHLTVLRIPLSSGVHNINVVAGNASIIENKFYSIENLEIKNGEKVYRKIRRY